MVKFIAEDLRQVFDPLEAITYDVTEQSFLQSVCNLLGGLGPVLSLSFVPAIRDLNWAATSQ